MFSRTTLNMEKCFMKIECYIVAKCVKLKIEELCVNYSKYAQP